MTVDSIGANYYALQQYPQIAYTNSQYQDSAALQYPQLQNDTVSFNGNVEEQKSNHKGLKIVLSLALTAVGAYFLHKNWKAISKFVDGLIRPDKKAALEKAEAISKKSVPNAEKIDKAMGLDKAAKARETKTKRTAMTTNWDAPQTKRSSIKRNHPPKTQPFAESSYKPVDAEELARKKTKYYALSTDWDGAQVARSSIKRNHPPVEGKKEYLTDYKPRTKKEIKEFNAKMKALKKQLGVDNLMPPQKYTA